MLTTNDESLADRARALCGHGISSTTFAREKSERPWFRSASFAGYNFRLSNVLAAIGVEQMKKIDWMNEQRRKHAAALNERLADLEELVLPVQLDGYRHVYQMYTIKLRSLNREAFVRGLREKGVSASVHFDPPVHKHAYYAEHGFADTKLPVTEKLSNTILTLPMFPQLTEDQIDRMVDAVRAVVASGVPGAA